MSKILAVGLDTGPLETDLARATFGLAGDVFFGAGCGGGVSLSGTSKILADDLVVAPLETDLGLVTFGFVGVTFF